MHDAIDPHTRALFAAAIERTLIELLDDASQVPMLMTALDDLQLQAQGVLRLGRCLLSETECDRLSVLMEAHFAALRADHPARRVGRAIELPE